MRFPWYAIKNITRADQKSVQLHHGPNLVMEVFKMQDKTQL